MGGIGLLSVDVLLPILEILQEDRHTVYNCSLVNHSFNVIASKILYSMVTISPPFRIGLDLKDEGLSVRTLRRVYICDTKTPCLAGPGTTYVCMLGPLCAPCTGSSNHR